MKAVEFSLNRLGKTAMLAALSDEEEEKQLKEEVNGGADYKVACTLVSGLSSDIKKNFVKSIVGCALQNGLIRKSGEEIHAVLHAALDAFTGVVHQVPAEASLKMKVGIASDNRWIAVAVYGDSAFYPLTNHERSALSMMHL